MKNSFLIAALVLGVFTATPLFAQTNDAEIAALKQRVAQLERQVQEISQLVEPLKAQLAIDNRRKALRVKFEQKAALDAAKHTREQLNEAEELYQVANKKWGTPEATDSLKTMIQKYPDINRTGCAVLYLAQKSSGEDRVKYLQDCITKYNDCFYGDGVQVGAYARFMLAQEYRSTGNTEKASALEKELKTQFAEAVDHNGNLLVTFLKDQ